MMRLRFLVGNTNVRLFFNLRQQRRIRTKIKIKNVENKANRKNKLNFLHFEQFFEVKNKEKKIKCVSETITFNAVEIFTAKKKTKKQP